MIYLLYSGNFDALTGGYIYNKQIIDYLRKNQVYAETIQLDTLQPLTSEKELLKNERLIRSIPDNSILLVDSLVFGSQPIFRTRYNPSHILIPVVHLPLFLNPDFQLYSDLKPREMEAYKMAKHIIVTSLLHKKNFDGRGVGGHQYQYRKSWY
ncbi:MAG: hypothetical protein HC830_04670 [Bacteroidetes bacterium]|nr:hypothetical protein [Bacteroidota bacterium]